MSRPGDWWVLDLDNDPTPGDTDRILSLSKRFLDFADVADRARRSVASLQGDNAVLAWIGKSGDAFREEFGEFPGQLQKLHDSHQMAGDALVAYAPALSTAQVKADRALADGRVARDLITSLAPQVDLATSESVVSSQRADQVQRQQPGASDPDPEQVRQALRDATAAKDRLTALQGQVNTAQQALDAAKSLADQARQLRDTAAGDCVKKIHEASDAGIKPRSFWQKLGEFFSAVWDGICEVAKWVALVAGVIALIIGGPLAWVAFGAGVILLIKTINDFAQGKGSFLDLAFALLGIIPGVKGLTSLSKLSSLYKEGGLTAIGRAALEGLRKKIPWRDGRAATGASDDIPMLDDIPILDDAASSMRSVDMVDDVAPVVDDAASSMRSVDMVDDVAPVVDDVAPVVDDVAPVLDDVDLKALEDYSGDFGYRFMNKYLRGDPEFADDIAGDLDLPQRVDDVSAALAKLPSSPGISYRGASFTEEVLSQYKVGQILTERAFTSTSAEISQARGFVGNVLFEIKGLNGKDIRNFSGRPDEAEVLFDRGTQFKVIGKEFNEEFKLWNITMREVSGGR